MGLVAMSMLGGIAALLLLLAQQMDPGTKQLGLTGVAWLSVMGSVFASFIFVVIQSWVNALRGAQLEARREAFETFVVQQGLHGIFAQRGSDDLQELYASLISGAKERVWAVGMTNKHFVQQHADRIADIIANRRVDVVVAFWDPDARLAAAGQEKPGMTLLELQSLIEFGAQVDGSTVVKTKQAELTNHVSNRLGKGGAKGSLRIVYLTCPTSFSALVVDDDVFFFPFLATAVESTNDPMLQCTSESGIGKAVSKHIGKLIVHPNASKLVASYPPTAAA